MVNTIYSSNKEQRITVPIDVMATGGAGIASVNRFSMLYMNPAALGVNAYNAFSVLKIGATINYDLIELAMEYAEAGDIDYANFSEEEWQRLLNLKAYAGINSPLALGYIGYGIGILLYNDIVTSFKINQAPGLPSVDLGIFSDIGLSVNYGFEVPLPFFIGKFSKLYAGINLKYIFRIKQDGYRMSLLEAFDIVSAITEGERGLLVGHCISSDVGFLFDTPNIAVGLVIRDWFNPPFVWGEYNYVDGSLVKMETDYEIERTYFYPSLDIGMAYKSVQNLFVLSEMNFYFDIVNSLDFSENYLLKLRLGAEVTLLRVFKFRAGLYKGYPTIGLGIDLPVINFNFAYYTEELGRAPGNIPQERIMFDIHLIF
jgi:hypothetical protein